MACITNIRHILRRDGTNRFDRLPAAFDPSYVQIDEKTTDDLLQLISEFAGQIQFYNRECRRDGDWQPFFTDFSRQHEPHIALVLTFLKLFQEARDHLNEIGQRHIDHYYQRFLQIQQRAAVPDKVHLLIETAKHVVDHKLAKGTKFSGGKDKSGKPIMYESEREIILNKASIESLRSVFVDRARQFAVYSADAANSADGKGADFESEEPKWSAFGQSQSGLSVTERTMTEASIGFAIASPVFLLNEGQRIITLNSHLNELPATINLKLASLLNRNLDNSLVAQLTGEKGWIEDLNVGISWNPDERLLILSIVVEADQPSVNGYDKEIHQGNFDTRQPVLKILTNSKLANHPYNWLRSLSFRQINLSVNVNGVKSLILQNELGLVDGEKPFQPFGPAPVKGSVFYIGCNEAFNKKLTALKLRYKWKDLPTSLFGFNSYYSYYNGSYTNDGFTFKVAALNRAAWEEEKISAQRKLFQVLEISKRYKKRTFRFTHLGNNELSHTLNTANFRFDQIDQPLTNSRFSHTTKSGFLKMEISGQDFGHMEFPTAYAKQSVVVSKAILDDKTAPSLPNPPYTPVMEYLTLDYTCESVIDLTGTADAQGNAFFHVYPFGEVEIKMSQQVANQFLLPNFDKQGYFFIGLKDLNPPQNLSLLFQVAEDSADPELIDDQKKITWSYLGTDGWKEFIAANIISDSTHGLLRTGIILFNIPKEAVSANPSMPLKLHWLCASYDGDVRGINKMIGLYPQAISAVFNDQGNDSSHYDNPLKAETISKLLVQDSSIKKITQPFASFGGQKPEEGNNYPVPYYTRVSERLRHKNRGVTVWDIERIVLGHFPNIYKVKALNHASATTDTAPGHITIVVIEKVRNQNAVNPLQPRTGRNTLLEIKDCASKYVSPFVEVFVQNPIYEEVQVDFKVAFKPGFDPGYYKTKLNEDIKHFLSPWAYEEGEDIVFGNTIYKSAIYYFVEKRDYVDYVMDFRMSHIKPNWGIGCMEILEDFYVGVDETLIDVDKAEPRTSRSILVSAQEHRIEIIENAGVSNQAKVVC
ncbi:MAG: hypothetical protein IH598_08890 [Bacteroidales bacterium]|nr:hypothetical protein [Bacteroidales bacterium]